MQISILDAMTLVTRAVDAELSLMDLGQLLSDGGDIRIQRAAREYPCRFIWAELRVQAGGVTQPLRIEIAVDEGRMVGDINPVIRAFVAAAIAFAQRHELLAIQRRQMRSEITKVVAEAACEGIELELLTINRLERTLLDDHPQDAWEVELMMYGLQDDEIVHDAFRIAVHTLQADDFATELRSYWLPEQRKLRSALPGRSAAA